MLLFVDIFKYIYLRFSYKVNTQNEHYKQRDKPTKPTLQRSRRNLEQKIRLHLHLKSLSFPSTVTFKSMKLNMHIQ